MMLGLIIFLLIEIINTGEPFSIGNEFILNPYLTILQTVLFFVQVKKSFSNSLTLAYALTIIYIAISYDLASIFLPNANFILNNSLILKYLYLALIISIILIIKKLGYEDYINPYNGDDELADFDVPITNKSLIPLIQKQNKLFNTPNSGNIKNRNASNNQETYLSNTKRKLVINRERKSKSKSKSRERSVDKRYTPLQQQQQQIEEDTEKYINTSNSDSLSLFNQYNNINNLSDSDTNKSTSSSENENENENNNNTPTYFNNIDEKKPLSKLEAIRLRQQEKVKERARQRASNLS